MAIGWFPAMIFMSSGSKFFFEGRWIYVGGWGVSINNFYEFCQQDFFYGWWVSVGGRGVITNVI